jgi:glycosyltransferase involved in cell wall biosynthesis
LLAIVASTRGANLIHTTPDYSLFFHRKSAPMIITFQNYVLDRWMRDYSTWLQKMHYATDLRLWTKTALKKCSAITAVSESTARIVKQDMGLTEPIRVIYNGVDSNHFVPDLKNKLKGNEVRVFFSGNLTVRKGAQWLGHIAKKLKNNVAIFYTQGLRTGNIYKNSPRLYSIGPVSFEEMPQRYQQMDILIMPTVREGLSLAVLEAMACALPVVASNCSSLPELIDDGQGGFLCPIGDVDAFAEKINLLAEAPALRREMGEYNRSKVEKTFTIEKISKAYQELFEEVLTQY